MKCILSGLEIPPGKFSREHYVPRCMVPPEIASLKGNIYPAVKIMNTIKGHLYPCEWEKQKYRLIYNALFNWHIKPHDKKILRLALKGMPEINPCEYCICMQYQQYCIKER